MFNCLNGNLGGIKVYDEKKKVGETDSVYVLLSTQTESPTEDNDCTFITKSIMDVEIIVKTGFEVTKDTMDDLANLILGLVVLSPQVSGLTVPSGFQFTNLYCSKSVSRNLTITNSESVLTKILTFVVNIVQQN